MEESIEVLAHESSLSPLDAEFLAGKWPKEDCRHGQVEGCPCDHRWQQPCASMFSEVILFNVKQVCDGKRPRKE